MIKTRANKLTETHLVQLVDQGKGVGGEAEAPGVDLGVLHADLVIQLGLGPLVVDNGAAQGVDDGQLGEVSISTHGNAGVLTGVEQSH